MTSVLARLGQLESRTAVQSIWRPKKRKREEWVCRQCQGRVLQRRGYSDDPSLKVTVGDYLFQPRDERKEDDEGVGPRISRAWGGPVRGRPQPTQSGTWGELRQRVGIRGPLNAPISDGEQWPTEYPEGSDRTASHESAQNVLWERFEETQDEAAQDIQATADPSDFAVSEDDQGFTFHESRDASLLDINYAATLPEALARREADLIARCLFAAAKHNDLEFIRAISSDTMSEILVVLEPRNTIDKLASAHVELSEATRKVMGMAPMQRVAYEYSLLVSEVVAIRRSAGIGLTLPDYVILLRAARDLGKPGMSRAVWKSLQLDNHVPDTVCYNYYMAGRILSRMHAASSRHKLRIIPFHMLARKAPNLGENFRAFRVGSRGLKEQVMAIFREMLSNGATADQESFRLVMTAAAHEGDMSTVKSVLRKVWNINVDAMLAGTAENDMAPKELSKYSSLHPNSDLLFTIAHAFAINNDIPTALRLVDFVARSYDLTIEQETWAHLFEWTFVLAVPRTGSKANTDGTKIGQLPLQSVMNLWDTMTGAPYFVQPTMGMYNHLIKNLFYRDMSPKIMEKMTEGRRLYNDSVAHARKLWYKLEHLATVSRQHGHHRADGESMELLRREWEYAELVRKRNLFWCKRWLRLLLGSLRASMTIEQSGEVAHRIIPRLIWDWQAMAPTRLKYETATGLVEFQIRDPSVVEENRRYQERQALAREKVLEEARRYVGEDWMKSWRLAGVHDSPGTEPTKDRHDAKRVHEPHPDPDKLGGEDTEAEEIRAEMRDAIKGALETR